MEKPLLTLLTLIVGSGSLFASSTLTWDATPTGTGPSYGGGVWDTTSSLWYNGTGDTTFVSDGTNAVVFGGTATGTPAAITISPGVTMSVASMAFNTSGYVISGGTISAGGAISLAAGVTAEIDSSLTQNGKNNSLVNGSLLTLTGGGLVSGNWEFSTSGSTSTATVDLKSGSYGTGNMLLWLAGSNLTQENATVALGGGGLAIGYSSSSAPLSTYTVNGASASVTQAAAGSTSVVGRSSGKGEIDLKQGSVSLLGGLALGNDQASVGTLLMEGGTLSLGAKNLYINNAAVNSGGSGTATFTGGVTTLNEISFGNGGIFAAGTSGTLNMQGGTLYVGAGGIITNALGTLTTAINLSGGTIGATATWSSLMNMALSNANGGVTFQAGDALSASHDIALSGILSDSPGSPGSLTKSGGGTLTLAGTNSYSGGTAVTAGTLATGSVGGNLGIGNVTVGGGATLLLGNSTSIADNANLTFVANSTISLDFTGTETIGALFDSSTGVSLPAGDYTAAQLNSIFGGVFNGADTGMLDVTATVPEPATWILLLLGSGGIFLLARRRLAVHR